MVKIVLAVAPLATMMVKAKVSEATAHLQLLVGSEQEKKHRRSVDVASAHTMLSELQEAVAKRVDDAISMRVDEDGRDEGKSNNTAVPQAIATAISEQFELLEAHMVTEQAAQQVEATNSNSAIDACNSQKDTSFGSAANLESLVTSAKTAHSSCRVTEKSDTNSRDVACQSYYEQGSSFVTTAPKCTCSYDEQGSVTSLDNADALKLCFDNNKAWVAAQTNFVSKQSSCIALTSAAATHGCDATQTTYENTVCTHNRKITDICSTFVTCLAPENQDTLVDQRAAKLAGLADIVSAHQQAFNATQIAGCLLNLLVKVDPPTGFDLMDCTHKVVNVSHLDITFPSKVDPGTCSVASTSPQPGDAAWALEEYQGEDWGQNVQAVTPCLTLA